MNNKGKRFVRSIFGKTAIIFVIVALTPVTILGLRGQHFFSEQLNNLVDQGVIDQAEADFQVGLLQEQSFIYMGYGIVIALVFGYFFAGSLVRPIRKLEQGASRIGAGRFNFRVETDTDDELEELASTINHMATSLQTREEQLNQRNRQLSVLYNVAHTMSESRDLDDLLTYALERATQITDSEHASVLLKDRNEELVAVHCLGLGCEIDSGIGMTKFFKQVAAKAVAAGESMVSDRNEAAGLPAFETVACVPLKFEGFVQGAICVSGKKADFVPENLDLLSAIGSEVAVAIENTRLFEKLESQNRELATAVTEIVNLFSEAERNKSFGTRYENLNLTRCWEVKSCDQTACPAHGLEENLRCWQLAGTHCGGEVQGVFAQKLGRCEKCEVYKRACPDRITVLGETFNNMMAILEQRVKEHEEMQLQLYRSAKLAAIGELAAGVAHEINNPLTGILGNAMLMKSDAGGNKSLLKKISVIESEALRARDIVRNLLDFAHQNNDLARDMVELDNLIEQTLFLVRHQANLSSVRIDITVEEGLPELAIDANQMKQVFMNIIHNAIHSMEHGGTLEIKARGRKSADGDEVEISFKDSGCGMDADAMSRIFDPFFTTKKIGEGTGLGLSVSQRIVDDHGGKILVSSQPGEGSIFTVVLPLNNPAREIPRQVA